MNVLEHPPRHDSRADLSPPPPHHGSVPPTSTTRRWVSLAAVLATYALIVMGGVVRASGSGLGCPDWPLCHGRILPPAAIHSVLEFSHRALGAIASILMIATVALALRGGALRRRETLIAVAIPPLLLAQILLGAVTVALELPPMIVLVHLGVALVILGLLIMLTVRIYRPASASDNNAGRRRLIRLAIGGAAAVYLLALTGAYVRASGASFACAGFPTCNGALLPLGSGPGVNVHLLHRLLAFAVAAHLAIVVLRARRVAGPDGALRRAAWLLGGCLLAQLAIGATAVSTGVPPAAQALHLAGAAAVWAAAVTLAAVAASAPVRSLGQGPASLSDAPGEEDRRGPSHRAEAPRVSDRFRAYVSLTKPRIISLLLVTTLAGMVLAANGWPPLTLVIATLMGGALGAGGANAINCWIDRDIDSVMRRTVLRAIPSGIVTPKQALAFGLVLTAASFVVMAVFVNLLAAILTTGSLVYYVLVYTAWLKRSSVHNIVIGGAAGAAPPLIGWAAATGEVSLLAIYLFATVFYWTPPHFWALSLLIKGDYARAKVPMLPVVRGDEETRRQILLYSILLCALTATMFAFGLLGPVYLLGALALGGLMVLYSVQLCREASQAAARRLYKYSLLYLPLLFAAMIVDRQLPRF